MKGKIESLIKGVIYYKTLEEALEMISNSKLIRIDFKDLIVK